MMIQQSIRQRIQPLAVHFFVLIALLFAGTTHAKKFKIIDINSIETLAHIESAIEKEAIDWHSLEFTLGTLHFTVPDAGQGLLLEVVFQKMRNLSALQNDTNTQPEAESVWIWRSRPNAPSQLTIPPKRVIPRYQQ